MSMAVTQNIDQLCINTIRTLSMDAVQQANSGHPGTPMALAPVMYALWENHLRFNPANPGWANRDRFVLSCGHASMLLYSALHLYGYDVSLDDLKAFRQLGSKCAGHPEHGLCPGVETTTGPLGQGLGNSVGMAIAEKKFAAYYNRPGFDIVDHSVYALCGDGDLMEGVGYEAASVAGHQGLDNLIWIYDSNRITIDGSTDLSFSESVADRFSGMGWHVQHVTDANDTEAVSGAIAKARDHQGQPSLIVVDSQIGFGSPAKQGTCDAHGAPLGEDEIRATKEVYGWDPDARFLVPEETLDHMAGRAKESGSDAESTWNTLFEAWSAEYPDLAEEWKSCGQLPDGWDADLPVHEADEKGMATRKAGGKALAAVASRVSWLMGGSADLAGSNNTTIPGEGAFCPDDRAGRNFNFGVREHAMGAIANGMCLSGLRAYTGTFFVFSDYCRPVHRLAALMKQPTVFIYTHDSIGVGEDGPTHQPIEHLAAMRAIPGLDVIRPADANEVSEAWRYFMPNTDRPVALVLSRQNLPVLDRTRFGPASGLSQGAYVLADCEGGDPEVILIATGSEVSIAVEAWERLTADGVKARVVSMPCWEQFERQDDAYRDSVFPRSCTARVAVEAGSSFGWERWVGFDGEIVARDDYGESAPAGQLFEHFGLTADAVEAAARRVMGS